ncbi:MgtC/SapB family protein [Gordonia sp. TBRC 11910]|uniref:MgtC/SapB family protein n=2 Tax=Gordonia asplenii TaxID=2725283 RepID=A0A848KMT4_9ACTN|nr:MgtC/SapB family protein [Gordonia asplenii]
MLLGVAIGVERQWQAHNAYIQTYALVALGAAVFVIFGAHSFPDVAGDPRRVAAQVVSGIGFLCGGVILKQGVSIVGLNTAATIWATAAVGALCGAGMFAAAAVATAIVFVGNFVLRPLGAVIGRRAVTRETEQRFLIEVDCRPDAEAAVRGALFDRMRADGFRVVSVDSTQTGSHARISAQVSTHNTRKASVTESLESLASLGGVEHARWAESSA